MLNATPFQQLLDRMTATPALDKLEAFAKDWKAQEEQDRRDEEAAYERRMQAKQDDLWAARAADRDDGETEAA